MFFGPLAQSSKAVQYGVIVSLTSYAQSETEAHTHLHSLRISTPVMPWAASRAAATVA